MVRLPGDLSAPSSARRFVRRALDGADSQMLTDVELMVSELVTNAVVHTTSEPRLELEISPTLVRVGVYDSGPGALMVRQPQPHNAGGRGLLLVSTLATRWGTEPDGNGKVVWFELDTTTGHIAR